MKRKVRPACVTGRVLQFGRWSETVELRSKHSIAHKFAGYFLLGSSY
jgi:hypothetical protein